MLNIRHSFPTSFQTPKRQTYMDLVTPGLQCHPLSPKQTMISNNAKRDADLPFQSHLALLRRYLCPIPSFHLFNPLVDALNVACSQSSKYAR